MGHRWRASWATIAVALAVGVSSCGADGRSTATQDRPSTTKPDTPGVADPRSDEALQGGSSGEQRELGTFTYGVDVTYEAIDVSCDRGEHEPGGASDSFTFALVDPGTRNSLQLVLVTQNGTEFGVELFHGGTGEPVGSANVETEAGDADRTTGEGIFDDGTPFRFALVLPVDCDD